MASHTWPAEVAAKLLGVPVDPRECAQMVRYEKLEPDDRLQMSRIKSIVGLPAGDDRVYEFVEYNLRSKDATAIPDGFKKARAPSKYYKDSVCGTKKILLSRDTLRAPTHAGAQLYRTHDNGGRPFLVYVTNTKVFAYTTPHKEYHIPDFLFDPYEQHASERESTLASRWLYSKPVFEASYEKVWIGKSVKNDVTEFGGGYGDDFDGNAILLKETHRKNSYVLIHSSITRFVADQEIVQFVSNVGNNDVPYPYAVDLNGHVYLLLNGVKMTSIPKNKTSDPYEFFYAHDDLLTAYMATDALKQKRPYDKFLIGNDAYTLSWTPHPASEYRRLKRIGSPLQLVKNGERTELTPAHFAKLMNDFAQRMGWKPLRMHELVARDM